MGRAPYNDGTSRCVFRKAGPALSCASAACVYAVQKSVRYRTRVVANGLRDERQLTSGSAVRKNVAGSASMARFDRSTSSMLTLQTPERTPSPGNAVVTVSPWSTTRTPPTIT